MGILQPWFDRCASPILAPSATSPPAAMPAKPFISTTGSADVSLQVVTRYHWRGHAYCLMDNHYHLLLETPQGNLSVGVRQLNGAYTQRCNRRHARVGHVFQGRFKAVLVERDSYLLELCRYVVLNPVRAGLVKQPERYRWSSYRATAGLEKAPEWLAREWVLGQFSSQQRRAESKYQQFVQDGIGVASPWRQVQGQVVLGRTEFVEILKPLLAGKAAVQEIPRMQRLVARPTLEEIVPTRGGTTKAKRDRAIWKAHVQVRLQSGGGWETPGVTLHDDQ